MAGGLSDFINDLMQNSQYRGSVFKVPMLFHWAIMVTGPDKIEDIRRAPDDVLGQIEEVPILCPLLHINL